MKKTLSMLALALLTLSVDLCRAECSLDHFIMGVNRDSVAGSGDDDTLFVDCNQKYRHATGWYYPLASSIFPSFKYRIGEPGFDAFQSANPADVTTYDPNRALAGRPEVDFRIMVEVVALSPGVRVEHKDVPNFYLTQVGDRFNHSGIWAQRNDSHMHLSWQADSQTALRWVTLRLVDDLGGYQSSQPFTLVFNRVPAAGDLWVDGRVDLLDLARLQTVWLRPGGGPANDYHERADGNRDGRVDLLDYATLAGNWLGR